MKKLINLLLVLALASVLISCDKANFTVNFVSDGENLPIAQTVVEGETLKEPNSPVKDGYEFDGWFIGEEEFDFSTPITQDLTLTAKWVEIIVEFNVQFKNQDGALISQSTVKKGEKVTPPQFIAELGYEFLGWFLGEEKFDFNSPITQDVTLVAKVKIIEETTYTVTFLTDSEQSDFYFTVIDGETVSKPTDPQKYGYEFLGWYADGVEFDFATPITTNVILTARWQELPVAVYSVTFYSDGKVISSITVSYGELLSIPNEPKKDGYVFDKWLLNGAPYDFSTPVIGNLILTASWTKIQEEIVYFTINYVDGESVLASVTVEKGATVEPYDAPEKDGFNFNGWYLSGLEFDFTTPIESDLTLIADWSEIEKVFHQVNFDFDNGELVYSIFIEEGSFAVAPEDPQKDGFIFVGWFNGEDEFDFLTPITKSVDLIAKWTESFAFDRVVGSWSGVETYAGNLVKVDLVINADNSGSLSYNLSNSAQSYQIVGLTYFENLLTIEYTAFGRLRTLILNFDGEKLYTNYGVVGGEMVLEKT